MYAGGNGSLEATFSYQGNATSGNIYLRNSNRTTGAEYFYRFNIGASVAITAKNGFGATQGLGNFPVPTDPETITIRMGVVGNDITLTVGENVIVKDLGNSSPRDLTFQISGGIANFVRLSGVNAPMSISFNGNATPDIMNTVARQVQYNGVNQGIRVQLEDTEGATSSSFDVTAGSN